MVEITNVEGAKLIFSRIKGFKSASLGVFINAGARYENKDVKGVAHFLEHMVFKGSKKYSYKAIKREIEGRGGILNGFTSQETTAYYSQCLSRNAYKTMDILLDMAVLPSLDEGEMEKERNVVLEEVKMHNDLPSIRASSLLDKLLWEKHPLGEEVLGYPNTIARIRKNNLQHFKNGFYTPSNIIVTVVADCDKDRLSNIIRDKLSRIPESTAKSGKTHPPKTLRGIKILTEQKEINQTHLCMGFRGPSYHSKDRFTVELLHIIMGANMSSRLFEEVREKRGLCYDISTEVRKFKDSGAFCIHTGLDAQNIPVALKRIFKELIRIKDKKITVRELERARDYLFGQIVMSLEKPEGKMFYLADSYLALKKIYTEEKVKELIWKITPEIITRFARGIFDFNKMCLSCVSNNNKNTTENKIRNLAGSFANI